MPSSPRSKGREVKRAASSASQMLSADHEAGGHARQSGPRRPEKNSSALARASSVISNRATPPVIMKVKRSSTTPARTISARMSMNPRNERSEETPAPGVR